MAAHGGEQSPRVRDARVRASERLHRQRSRLRPLAVGLVAVILASTAEGRPAPGWHGNGPWLIGALVVWVVALGLITFDRVPARADPPLIALMAMAGVAIAALQDRGATEIPGSVAVWLAMTRLELRRGLVLSLAATAGLAVALAAAGGSSASVAAAILLCVLLAVMAQSMRQARESQDRAELLVAELEEARAQQAQAAALAERGRIAGELHDVLAHSLSGAAIVLQGARMLAEREGASTGVRKAIDRSSDLVRSGLLEARRAVSTLRGGELPGTRDLPELVERFAGDLHVRAKLHVEGRPRALSADAELAVYRAVQEALTNVARYAPAANVSVRLRFDPQTTALTVRNSATDAVAPGLSDIGGGHGLEGMRDRVQSLGGRMSAGRCGEDWVVEVELPE